jgi:two-component system response regulator BaeR
MHGRPWQLDDAARTLVRDGTGLRLTPTEWRLLSALLAAEGRICSRSELLDCAQAGSFRDVCDRTVDIHIRSLRRKITTVNPQGTNIESVYGQGYRIATGPAA